MAESISSPENTLHQLYAALAASRYLAAPSCFAVICVASILIDNQHDSLQQEIAHIRDLAAWETRNAAIVEQSRYAAKLHALKARNMIDASASNGRRTRSTIENINGEWELIEHHRRRDVHLRFS